MALTFDSKTMVPIRKVLRKANTSINSIFMFEKDRNNNIFRVLTSVVYCIVENYVCANYLCCPQTKIVLKIKDLRKQHTMIFQESVFQNYNLI